MSLCRNSKLGNAEIAMTMELRTEGVPMKLIAYVLGVRADTLTSRILQAEREGMLEENPCKDGLKPTGSV